MTSTPDHPAAGRAAPVDRKATIEPSWKGVFTNATGRGVAANVRGYPVAHRPPAGTARVDMRGGEVKVQRATEGKACLDAGQSARASAPVPARARFDRPFARTEHDLSLHKPVEGSILAPKPPGIWLMSVPINRIYISYRRTDTAAYAGRLFDHLSRHFGRGFVFMDIQGGITPGQDFAQVINAALDTCDVALVLIGKHWATSTGPNDNLRLDDPNDWVRVETAAALRRNVLVIPVLVEGARLPDPASLPENSDLSVGVTSVS
jgi:TIR domain